ncbi:MAG: hypothetical protein IPM91_02245 [Bacteroidetes bacterium]|nr:hypothetical protein [Bacteroidota bacterium]
MKGYPLLIEAYLEYYNINDTIFYSGERIENEYVELYAIVNGSQLKWFFIYLLNTHKKIHNV